MCSNIGVSFCETVPLICRVGSAHLLLQLQQLDLRLHLHRLGLVGGHLGEVELHF